MANTRWLVQLLAITIYFSRGKTTATVSSALGQPSNAIKPDEVVILKIGGSSITNKAEEETLDEEALDWFAKLVAESIDSSFLSSEHCADENKEKSNEDDSNANHQARRQFIIVHGAGSFGHHSAKRFGLRCGKAVFLEELDDEHCSDNASKGRKLDPSPVTAEEMMERRRQMLGLCRTRRSVQKLNIACVSALIDRGVNAVGISPGMTYHGLRAHGAAGLSERRWPSPDRHDDVPRGMRDFIAAIKECLRAGLVPVVHGDACLLYDGIRAGILGGDTLSEGIATLWDEDEEWSKISRVIFITDVAGVFTSDPKSDEGAELIRSLKVCKDTGELTIDDRERGDKNLQRGDALNVSGSSHSHDVTGGLKAKLGAAVSIVQAGVDVIISQCGTKSTEKFVRGDWRSVLDVEAGTLLSRLSTESSCF